jgi:hypothetical protein
MIMTTEWKLITSDQMRLENYPCGVRAGDILRLRRGLHIRDHRNRMTGTIHLAGEENVVLLGNPDEPNIIWLERPGGEQHTWDETVLHASN